MKYIFVTGGVTSSLGKGIIASMQFLEENQQVLDNVKKACYNITSTDKTSDIAIEEISIDEPSLEEEIEDEWRSKRWVVSNKSTND